MKRKLAVLSAFCLASISIAYSQAQLLQPTESTKVRVEEDKKLIIFDTDMSHDVDDVGALAVLHALADKGECEILGIGISTPANSYDGYYVAPCADAINTYYERPDIQIGAYRGPNSIIDIHAKYPEAVSKAFKHDISNSMETPHAWKMYRRILASQQDSSVTFVVVGFLNNLELLLDSEPDEYSNLNGYELVKQKVRLLSCMGGNFPSGDEDYNFNLYSRSALYVLSSWPSPVVFGGGELGNNVLSGGILKNKFRPEENPVAMAWHIYNGGDQRSSWDELTTIYAVKGTSGYFRLSEPGICTLILKGIKYMPDRYNTVNTWIPISTGRHRYLIPLMDNDSLGKEIDGLLIREP